MHLGFVVQGTIPERARSNQNMACFVSEWSSRGRRVPNLFRHKEVLYVLSYGMSWWEREGLNLRHLDYETSALPLSYAPKLDKLGPLVRTTDFGSCI